MAVSPKFRWSAGDGTRVSISSSQFDFWQIRDGGSLRSQIAPITSQMRYSEPVAVWFQPEGQLTLQRRTMSMQNAGAIAGKAGRGGQVFSELFFRSAFRFPRGDSTWVVA